MAEIPRNNTGLSGEYFVAAELYRRGWSVGMTIGNAKAVDLYAEKGDKRIAIQVKSLYKRKHNGWPITKDKVKENCFYVFVILNGDTMALPDYFICDSSEVIHCIDTYGVRGIVTISKLNALKFKDNWSKLEK